MTTYALFDDKIKQGIVKVGLTFLEEIVGGGFKERVTILTSLEPELKTIKADFSQMEQVGTNILLNSIEAISDNGLIKIITENLEKESLIKNKISIWIYRKNCSKSIILQIAH
jgi:nitrogen-specific signal transduction histidine kinase